MPVALAANEAPALLKVSSSVSVPDATGDVESAIVGVDVLADAGAVALAVRSGVDVAPAEVTGGAVAPDAQPATRRTTRKADAPARNRKLDRKRASSPASVFLVAGDAEPILGSNPRQDLVPIGIRVPPFPYPMVIATATIRNHPILRVAWVPCALTAHSEGHGVLVCRC
jgi:hypothetical protein